jgi:hypothetical protein
MSFIKSLGLKLIGAEALDAIRNEAHEKGIVKGRNDLVNEQKNIPISKLVDGDRLENWFSEALAKRAGGGGNQINSALLLKLAGSDKSATLAIINAVHRAEASGEGWMKKKAIVLKVVREVLGKRTKSIEQLIIELAVQAARG